MLNAERWSYVKPYVNVMYSPRFTHSQRNQGVRKTVKIRVWDDRGVAEAQVEDVTHDEVYEAAKNLRLMYIMQHNLG